MFTYVYPVYCIQYKHYYYTKFRNMDFPLNMKFKFYSLHENANITEQLEAYTYILLIDTFSDVMIRHEQFAHFTFSSFT